MGGFLGSMVGFKRFACCLATDFMELVIEFVGLTCRVCLG